MTTIAKKPLTFQEQLNPSKASQLTLPTFPKRSLGLKPIIPFDGPRRYSLAGEHEVLVALVSWFWPRTVLEIGVNEGRTAKVLLQNIETIERYIGVDVTPDYVPTKHVQRREVPRAPGRYAKDDPRFELIVRPNGSFDLDAGDLPECDVVFIDGDHGWRGVLNDTLLARNLIRPGGIVIWHDYHSNPVVDVRAVLETLQQRGNPIFHVEDTWIAFQRF